MKVGLAGSAVTASWHREGEFYEISGSDPNLMEPIDWKIAGGASTSSRHFLFYLRDETFECLADDWSFGPVPGNALIHKLRTG